MLRKRRATLCVAVLALLAGCGQPTQKYGSSKADGVYFTVPYSWNEIATSSLNAYEAKSTQDGAAEKLAMVNWQVGFSPKAKVGAKEIFGFQATDAPLAFARVRRLFPEEINSISYNNLRDLVVPITDWYLNPTAQTPKFTLIDDYEVVEKAASGIRTIYSFVKSGVSQTVDQTAMVSNDRSTIYVFIIRCSSACYNKNKKEITAISDSFTVRGA
ncbi:MAG: hypothetical protein F2787_01880 [Actinobacteria bacterium]|uniref:Unannotated protein n=1 Tax=freshwater metagenome TaxID=449393 RepID=A0A6J7CW35_9ZZZZ|nr:hypothetical protein [Actinomycetota bacterium]MSX24501.1 hypothetical protein [Actinomycetota bacterium]MTB00185.1 hypothetical protein [Actinomycetota bacterium]